MSYDSEKKLREIEILKKVFSDFLPIIQESEQPDFVLTYNNGNKFGVEITELYYDGTSARLKKGKYIEQLLQEQKYWHKDDKKKVKVEEITYFSKKLDYKPIKMPALLLPKYTIQNYLIALKHTIESKEKKLDKYSADVSKYCMLIIYDCEGEFKDTSEENIAKKLFSMGILDSIRKSQFYEIYLVTNINGEQKYIPLKAYVLLSDCLLFFDFVKECKLNNKLCATCEHPLFGFAEVLKRRNNSKVLVEKVENNEVIGNLVIYNGRYGLGMISYSDNNWGIGIFDKFPLKEINSIGEIMLDGEKDFFDDTLFQKYEQKNKDRIASIGFNFQTRQ